LASSDGRYVLLAFGVHNGDGHEEHLTLLDARAGRWLPGEATLPGASLRYAFSPDLEHIVAVGFNSGVTTILRRQGLEVVAEYPHDPFEPVVGADFVSSELVALVTRSPDPRYGRESVLWWNPFEDRIEARHDVVGAAPATIVAAEPAVLVGGLSYDAYVTFDGRVTRWPRVAPTEAVAAAARNTDGTLFVRGFRQDVALHDASGALIGRPLYADINTLDWIVYTAFTPDGRALRVSSGLGQDMLWRLDRADEDSESLLQEVARLLPSTADQPVTYAPTAAERRRLRSGDPGAWQRHEARPAIDLARNARSAVPIPLRAPTTPPELLDLAPVYNRDSTWYDNTFWNFVSPRRFPVGIQQIGTQYFDIRGFVLLGASPDDSGASAQTNTGCIDVPDDRIAALHVLAQTGTPSPVPTGEAYGQATLQYRDGGSALLPLRAGIELPGFGGQDSSVPEVFVTDHFLMSSSGITNSWHAPRLLNPEPDRLLRCVDIEVTRPDSRLVIYAVTAEPVAATVL
jgi:hypothetical protein